MLDLSREELELLVALIAPATGEFPLLLYSKLYKDYVGKGGSRAEFQQRALRYAIRVDTNRLGEGTFLTEKTIEFPMAAVRLHYYKPD